MTSFSIAPLFQTNMILQQRKPIRVWGCAPNKSRIQAVLKDGDATLSQGETFEKDGSWAIVLPPEVARTKATLTVTCFSEDSAPETHIIENIAIGEVWLASGQSNMEFFLKYDIDWEQVKKNPIDPMIRMFNVPQIAFDGHTTKDNRHCGYWFDASSPALESFSAPGYSFALQMRKCSDVPIGIIGCNWGGTPARAWVSEDTLLREGLDYYITSAEKEMHDFMDATWPDKSEEEKLELLKEFSLKCWEFEDSEAHYKAYAPMMFGADRNFQFKYMEEHANDPVIPMGPYHHYRPFGVYHTMLKTIIPYSVKGVLWYQGESDSGEFAPTYDKILTALIKSWRKEWNDEDMTFLLVQLAPFAEWLACDNSNYRIVRANQQKVADSVENVYLCSIMDIGCHFNIHPRRKMEVGRRLALLAMGHVYHTADGNFDSPKVKGIHFRDQYTIAVSFDYAKAFHRVDLNLRKNLEAADENYLADFVLQIKEGNNQTIIAPTGQRIEGNEVILTFSQALNQEGVGYALAMADADYAEINFQNEAGLCPLPFCFTKVAPTQ